MEHFNSNGEPVNDNNNKLIKHHRSVGSVFWGVILIFFAVSLLINRLGYFDGFSLWPLVFSIGFAALMIEGMIKRSFGQILFSLAFLVIVNADSLHMNAITPWPVLVAALLGTIGLNILFPGFKRSSRYKGEEWCNNNTGSESINGATVTYKNSFGSSVKYLSGEIAQVNIDSSFGSLEVYFTEVNLLNDKASVYIDSSFGEVVLNIPADWKVIIDVKNSFAAISESGHCNPNGTRYLYVAGNISFGDLQIRYV